MAQTHAGAMKCAAKLAGLSPEEYSARVASGQRWCTGHKAWHTENEFGSDKSRHDGRAATCRAFRCDRSRRAYVHLPQASRLGKPTADTRDGDKRQARSRVNHAVDIGLFPDPKSLPCADCGHRTLDDGKRHEYHHHNGYGAEHQLDVIALCPRCHARRDHAVTHCKRGHEYTPQNTCVDADGHRSCRECRRARDRGRRGAAYWRAYRAKRKAAA